MPCIRVLIADDHRLFRQSLRQVCEAEADIQVVGEAVNGREAVEMACRLQPDVVLMDIGMPVWDGVQATRRIAVENLAARVIVLTVDHHEEVDVFEAIKAGAWGYLLKDVEERVLIEAVRAVHRGKALVDPQATARVLDEFRRISQAEKGKLARP